MDSVRFSLVFLTVSLGWPWPSVLAAHARYPNENPPLKAQRIDSMVDTPVKITVKSSVVIQSELFGSCASVDEVYVRFRYLQLPNPNTEFTRYVPNADQRGNYDVDWRVVDDANIMTALECAQYTQNDNNALMYQFDGSECRVSTVLMPMIAPSCNDMYTDAVFIQSSCHEPTVQVELTPAPGAMDISWTINDPCQAAAEFKIHWFNVEDDTVVVVDSDVFYYRIEDRLGCETQTVTVTVLDPFSQPYGGSTTSVSANTLPTGPPKILLLFVEEDVDFIDVTWTIADDDCLRINAFGIYWEYESAFMDGPYSETVFVDQDTYEFTISELHACLLLQIEVWAVYDDWTGSTNTITETTETRPEEPAIEDLTFVELSDGTWELTWNVRDFCNSLDDLKLSSGGNLVYLGKDARSSVVDHTITFSRTFTVIPIDSDGNEFGLSQTVESFPNFITIQRSVSSIMVTLDSPATGYMMFDGITVDIDETTLEYRLKHVGLCMEFDDIDPALLDVTFSIPGYLPLTETLVDFPMPGARHVLASGHCLYHNPVMDTTDDFYSTEAVCVGELLGYMFVEYTEGDFKIYRDDLTELGTRSPAVSVSWHFVGLVRSGPSEFAWNHGSTGLTGLTETTTDPEIWGYPPAGSDDCVNTASSSPYKLFTWGCSATWVVDVCHEYLP